MWIDPNVKRKGSIIDRHIESKNASFPVFSQFELSVCGVCNRFCEFCPRSDRKVYPGQNEYLTMDLYRKMISELARINYDGIIAYSGFSEPLLHKELNEFIAIARQACPQSRIEIYTNGDFLTEGNLKGFFIAGLTSMHISMYDGPEQEGRFNEMRKQAGLGGEQMVLRARYLTKEEGYGLTLSNRGGMVDFEKVGKKPLLKPMNHQCFYPFYMMMVDHDGNVLLCSHDWAKAYIAGNLNKETVSEIWAGENMRMVREKLGKGLRDLPSCRACDVKGTLIGEEHYQRWKGYYDSGRDVKG